MGKLKNEDNTFDINLGNVLKELREKRGLSQEDIASKLDVSKSAVCRWESGDNRMYAITLKEYCSILNISISYVFDLVENISTK